MITYYSRLSPMYAQETEMICPHKRSSLNYIHIEPKKNEQEFHKTHVFHTS